MSGSRTDRDGQRCGAGLMKVPLLSPLPPADFVSVAHDLRLLALSETSSLMALEEYVARHGGESVAKVLADVRRTAALVGRVSMFFEMMAPHEEEVRMLLAEVVDRAKGATA